MKYIVLLCDGLADRPIKELNNKTIRSEERRVGKEC